MTRGVRRLRFACAAIVGLTAIGTALGAQQKPAEPNDPRIGLKGGYKDAAAAARGMELVSSRPRPEGFFDERHPAGHGATAHLLHRRLSAQRGETGAIRQGGLVITHASIRAALVDAGWPIEQADTIAHGVSDPYASTALARHGSPRRAA